MTRSAVVQPPSSVPQSSVPRSALFAMGWCGLLVAYLLVFSLTGSTPATAIVTALANVLPVAALSWPVFLVIRGPMASRSLATRLAWHIPLGALFIGGWYALLIFALGVLGWLAGDGLVLRWFSGPALPWQLFQGLMIYCVVAIGAHAAVVAPAPAPDAAPDAAPATLTRYLMRQGDDIRPVDVAAIISIRGADDYSEVTTAAGSHLARMTLRQFAEGLDPVRFVRVHRSWIISFDRLERAEPSGDGRLLLHMTDGRAIMTSRAGAAALKRRLV